MKNGLLSFLVATFVIVGANGFIPKPTPVIRPVPPPVFTPAPTPPEIPVPRIPREYVIYYVR